jgi:hypothetical protein
MVVRRLNRRLQGVQDPAVINEEIAQAKIILFNTWIDGVFASTLRLSFLTGVAC